MVKIRINGKYYEADTDRNLLDTCLELGFDIPHFCYHPALGSVGACRLCAVKKYKDDADTKGRIIMSCMEPVVDGLIISTDEAEVLRFRTAVIEALMVNHPHDCPVCDEGGECQLQDMTVMTGHNYRRYKFRKRTYISQNLGPLIHHEMNRCIQCYRCVRFYNDFAGGKDLAVMGAADHVYFGRHTDGTLESAFSGNLVEVCPTGVFTDKTLRSHYTRKWDLTNTPSVCGHCSLGCNTIASARYGTVRRIMARYNGKVNGYFICDRGRFGYEYVNSSNRILLPMQRNAKNSDMLPVNKNTLQDRLAAALNGQRLMGIGSPRASIESNYALMRLVGSDNFYHGVVRKEQDLTRLAIDLSRNEKVRVPSLKEVEDADLILILGEDPSNTAPMLELAVRQAARKSSKEKAPELGIPVWNDLPVRKMAQDEYSPVYVANTFSTRLDEICTESYYGDYRDIARLGFAIAANIDAGASGPLDLDPKTAVVAEKIAAAIMKARKPVIISGVGAGSMDLLHSAANVAIAIGKNGVKAGLCFVYPEANSVGLGLLGGGTLDEALIKISDHAVDTLIILENDLSRRMPEQKFRLIFNNCECVISLDHLKNATVLRSDVLLPAATFAESTGTIVNNEGRAQRFYRVIPAERNIRDSWEWLDFLMSLKENNLQPSFKNIDDLMLSLMEEIKTFGPLKDKIPPADSYFELQKIPRQTFRFSGRTAIEAHKHVSEGKPPADKDSPLVFSMEGYKKQAPATLLSWYWAPGWNSVQAINKALTKPNAGIKGGDAGIRLFDAMSPLNQPYYHDFPSAFQADPDECWVVPLYPVFGAGELSARDGAITERIEDPGLGIGSYLAEKMGLKDGDYVSLDFGGDLNIKVKLLVMDSLPKGIAVLTIGLPGMPYIRVPEYGKLNIIQ